MVIDTSALVAILFNEPDAELFEEAIANASSRSISAASLLECSIVVEARYGEAGGQQLDLLLSTARIRVVEVTADQVDIARDGFRRFGKGRHPAGLNFGDCFAYALAVTRAEPLLFKGGDFELSDVTSALVAGR